MQAHKKMSTGAVPEALAELQTRFAAHIRNPESAPAPEGIEDRRMAIYRELFFNNIQGFLSTNFPVLRTLYDDSAWLKLCRDFYSEYRSHTPLFPEIPREFLRYLQDHRHPRDVDPPFMLELAHYEWVELALSLDEADPEDIDVNPDGDLLTGIPILSPLAWPVSYQFPVHRICVDFQPDSAGDDATHLLVWRQQDFSIRFMQLNEIAAFLLQKLKAGSSQTGLELLNLIARDLGHPSPGIVIEGGKALLSELREKQVILGTRTD